MMNLNGILGAGGLLLFLVLFYGAFFCFQVRILWRVINRDPSTPVKQTHAWLVQSVDRFCNRLFAPIGQRMAKWADAITELRSMKLLYVTFALTMIGYCSLYILCFLVIAAPIVPVLLLRNCVSEMPFVCAAICMGAFLPLMWILLARVRSTGVDLSRHEAPELFRLIDDLQPNHKLEKIYIDASYNLSVLSNKGLFGAKRRDLVIGYPALITLTTEQVKSVLAHEIGHMNERHVWLKEWILRSRVIWIFLMDNWRLNRPFVYAAMKLFFGWYIPMFSVLSFAVARLGEYEADNSALCSVAGGDYASSLMCLCIKQVMFQPYLQKALRDFLVQDEQFVPENLYEPIAQSLNAVSNERATAAWTEVVRMEDCIYATHPALLHRLAKLGFIANPPDDRWHPEWLGYLQISESAAEQLLGARCRELGEKLTTVWKKDKLSEEVNRPIAFLQRGHARFQSGKFEQAVKDYTCAITAKPAFAQAYASRSAAFYRLGQHEQAIADATRAIELKPAMAIAYSNRCTAFAELGKWQEVVSDSSKLIDLGGNAKSLFRAHLLRARAYDRLNDHANALKDCQVAATLSPQDAKVTHFEADLRLKLGNWKMS